MDTVQVRVSHRTDAAKFNDTRMNVKHLSTAERLIAAITTLAIWWVAAALAILVPVFHFVLVPAGFIGGVIFFFIRFKFLLRRDPTEIECPSCHQKWILKSQSFNWPVKETCNSCRSGLTIEPTQISSANS